MKINYLYIDGYKNLNKMKMFFEEDTSVNALIGNNGSGKSNVLEALTIIFSNIASGGKINFNFDVKYSIDESRYEIDGLSDSIIFTKNDQKLVRKKYMASLPKTIFLYYCGDTERLENFANEFIDKSFNSSLKMHSDVVLKYITYLKVKNFGCALLANAVYGTTIYKSMSELIGIGSIESPVILHLKRPHWSKNTSNRPDSLWNAHGAVFDVLHEIKAFSVFEETSNDYAKLIINDISKLKIDSEGVAGLFVKLMMLMQADILESIQFDIVKDGIRISHTDLSEGEKQLAQLVSILEITKEYKSLFLLDEFDSYLHPNWQRKFVELINSIDIRGQVLFTTHSTLTLGKMRKDNIIILKEGAAFSPSAETYNRDITEVLEELMNVEKRPQDVNLAIKTFRNAIVHGNKKDAEMQLETLSKLLSLDDPFFISARFSMARLQRE